jgi:hypothetical protein
MPRQGRGCLPTEFLAGHPTGPFTCERPSSRSTMIIDANSEDCPLSAG